MTAAEVAAMLTSERTTPGYHAHPPQNESTSQEDDALFGGQ